MEIEKLIKHMREEAQDYRSGRTLGRAFADPPPWNSFVMRARS